MRRYLADDAAAFEAIYATYADAVYGYLVLRVRSPEERDELFQRIWMKFHRARSRWTSEYPLLQWLFVISRSVLIDALRKTSRTALDRAEHPGESLERSLGELETSGSESDFAAGLAGTGLSPAQIEVLRLRAIDEEEYERIAARLGKTPANIRKIYSRAIEKLKAIRWRPAEGRNR